jgi:hypothetical protein
MESRLVRRSERCKGFALENVDAAIESIENEEHEENFQNHQFSK